MKTIRFVAITVAVLLFCIESRSQTNTVNIRENKIIPKYEKTVERTVIEFSKPSRTSESMSFLGKDWKLRYSKGARPVFTFGDGRHSVAGMDTIADEKIEECQSRRFSIGGSDRIFMTGRGEMGCDLTETGSIALTLKTGGSGAKFCLDWSF